jgi:polyphenol oxidase
MKIAFSEKLSKGRFETWTERPTIEFWHATQVHGTDIVSTETLPVEADGMIVSWNDFNRPLAIKTADCLPIVIEGETGVIFLHAGWKGLASGILQRPEINIIKPLKVFIGPSIQECCFEVSEEFKAHFPDNPFFIKKNERFYFNLQEEAKRILHNKYPSLAVEATTVCTCCHDKLHSYRRDKTKERNWNLFIKG